MPPRISISAVLSRNQPEAPARSDNPPEEDLVVEQFPIYTPSSIYDEKARGCAWSHYQASRRFWEYMIFAVTLITPIEISYVVLFDRHIKLINYIPFFIMDILQVIDNFVILKTPVAVHGILVTRPREVIRGFGLAAFIIHVVASLPLAWIGVIKDDLALYLYLSVNRLLRFHRAYLAYKTIYNSTLYSGTINHLFPHCILFIFIVHVFACVFYGLAVGLDASASYIGPYLDKPPIEKYTVSMYFVITTILTIGYGDIHPILTAECVVVIFMQVVGVAFEALVVAKMVTAISDVQGNSFIVKYDSIQGYLKSKGVSRMYTNHVRHYYQTVWESTHGAPGWNELMKELPESVRSAIKLELCEKAIYGVEIFRGMKQSDKLQLMDNLEAFTMIPGEIIYRQGDPVSDLLIFSSGTIQCLRDDVLFCRQTAEKSFFDGEKEFLFDSPRTKTLIAETFVEGWRLRRHHFGEMLHANPALKRLVLTNAKRKYPRDFTGWSRRMDLPEGALDAREGDQQEEIYPSDEFVDFERGESSSSST